MLTWHVACCRCTHWQARTKSKAEHVPDRQSDEVLMFVVAQRNNLGLTPFKPNSSKPRLSRAASLSFRADIFGYSIFEELNLPDCSAPEYA